MSSDQQQRGPSWADVRDGIRELEREYNVKTELVIAWGPATKHADAGLTVLLRQVGERPTWQKTDLPILWSAWPHSDHKTMPGLLVKMLHLKWERLHQLREESNKLVQSALF